MIENNLDKVERCILKEVGLENHRVERLGGDSYGRC